MKQGWLQSQVRSLALKEYNANLVKHIWPSYEFHMNVVFGGGNFCKDPNASEQPKSSRRKSSEDISQHSSHSDERHTIDTFATASTAASANNVMENSFSIQIVSIDKISWRSVFMFIVLAVVCKMILDVRDLHREVGQLRDEVASLRACQQQQQQQQDI